MKYFGGSQKLFRVKWRITMCKEHCNARNDKFLVYLVSYTVENKEFFQIFKNFLPN